MEEVNHAVAVAGYIFRGFIVQVYLPTSAHSMEEVDHAVAVARSF